MYYVTGFSDDSSVTSDKEQRYTNFLEYGKRFMKLLEEIGYPYGYK